MATTHPHIKVLKLWHEGQNTFAITPIGQVPPGRVEGQQQRITYNGQQVWLWVYRTIPLTTLQMLETFAGIIGGVGIIGAGTAAAGAAADTGAAAATGADTATAAATGGTADAAAAGTGAGLANKAASAVKSAASAISGSSLTKDAAIIGALALFTSVSFWIRVGEVILGAALLLLGLRAMTTGNTSIPLPK